MERERESEREKERDNYNSREINIVIYVYIYIYIYLYVYILLTRTFTLQVVKNIDIIISSKQCVKHKYFSNSVFEHVVKPFDLATCSISKLMF